MTIEDFSRIRLFVLVPGGRLKTSLNPLDVLLDDDGVVRCHRAATARAAAAEADGCGLRRGHFQLELAAVATGFGHDGLFEQVDVMHR